MIDLKDLTHEQFEPCLHDPFRVDDEQHAVELELIAVEPRQQFDPEFETRRGFSLIFRGPKEPVLEQQMHPLNHARLGELPVFLVPIGPDVKGIRYEAVFS